MKKLLLLSLLLVTSITMGFAAKKVAFVYSEGYGKFGYALDIDPIYKGLSNSFEVTPVSYTNTGEEADYEYLASFDCVVLSEAMSGNTTLTNNMVKLVGMAPVVSLKVFNYTNGRWNWATPKNPSSKCTSFTIKAGFEGLSLFKGLTLTNGNVIEVYDGSDLGSNLVQGFADIIDTENVLEEKVYATTTVDNYFAIHEVVKNNYKYVMIPLSSDKIATATDNAAQLVVNAVNYVSGGEETADEAPSIAYIYEGSDAYSFDEDYLCQGTAIAEQNTQGFDLKGYIGGKPMADSLQSFDLLVISPAVAADSKNAALLHGLINRVPILNFNPGLYSAWGEGAEVIPAATSHFVAASEEAKAHEVFANCSFEGDNLVIFADDNAIDGKKCLGYSLSETSNFTADEVLAKVGDANAIHIHGTRNAYMLLPMASDYVIAEGDLNLTETATTLISNAITYLADTKANVFPASAPSFAIDFGNEVSVVTLSSSTKGAKIYYTTDGTEPTTASTLYTEPISVTTDGTVIKALAVAMGYNDSEVSEKVIMVKSVLAAPTLTYSVADGVANVIITAPEGGKAYYNFTGSSDPECSSEYIDSIGLQLTQPTIITCMSCADDKLPSAAVEFVIDIPEVTYYADTLLWENFSTFGSGDLVKAYDFYASRDTLRDEAADTIISITRTPADSLTLIDTNELWYIGTYGQRINNQSTSTSTKVGGSYGPVSAMDAGATEKTALSFLVTAKGDNPASAYIQTKNAYAGPFMLSAWITGQASASYYECVDVQVSTDGTKWNSIGEIGTKALKQLHRGNVFYDGTEPVYIKIASNNQTNPSKQKTMLFDVAVFGPSSDRPSTGIESAIVGEKAVKAVRMYNMAGQQVRVAERGVNIIMKVYSDGSVETKKVLVK